METIHIEYGREGADMPLEFDDSKSHSPDHLIFPIKVDDAWRRNLLWKNEDIAADILIAYGYDKIEDEDEAVRLIEEMLITPYIKIGRYAFSLVVDVCHRGRSFNSEYSLFLTDEEEALVGSLLLSRSADELGVSDEAYRAGTARYK